MIRTILATGAIVFLAATAVSSQSMDMQQPAFTPSFDREVEFRLPRDILPMPVQMPPPDISPMPDITWVEPPIDADMANAYAGVLGRDCATCYPAPEIAPFPIPVSLTIPGPPEPPPQISPWPASHALDRQLALLEVVSSNDVCRTLLRRLLRLGEQDCDDGLRSTGAEHIEVLEGGEALPVFLIHLAAKSSNLAKFDGRALEAHRFYLMFVIDPKLQLNIMVFDYEPLFNRSSAIADVLNRFHDNTAYIPVEANEGIADLTEQVRVAVGKMLIELAERLGV